jgi:hypothetical protein
MKKEKSKKSMVSRLLASTPAEARDTGMAVVLICLLLGYWGILVQFLPISIFLLLLTMVWPNAFRPLAVIWFGLSRLLGEVVSRVVLTVLFFLLVTPIGLIRRWTGADDLQLKKWKKGEDSVFVLREGPVKDKDLVQPF